MQNEEFEKLIQSARAVRLSEDEKTDMLASIRFAMREPAVPAKPPFSFRMFFASRYAFASFLVLFVTSLSVAGVSSAAEKALPGDLLYPVKVQVNEKVVSALAITPEKKARVESNFTVRRLKEAEALAEQGRLDEVKRTSIQENLATHSEKAIEVISKIEEKPAAELNKGLDTSLNKHIEILKKLTEKQVGQEKKQTEKQQKTEFKETPRSYKTLQKLRERAERFENDRERGDSSFRTRNR